MRLTKKKQRHPTDKVACIILAGGKGTRLAPLTNHRCKPSVMFGGHYRLIDIPISNALNAEIRNIYVVAQYFSSSLSSHIKETFSLDHYQGSHLTMLTPEETPEGKVWFDGTADAIRKNMHHLLETEVDYVLILSGDQLYNMDLSAMIHFAKEKDADLTIASLPVGEECAKRMGIMSVNDSMDITAFSEKPSDPSPYALSESFLKKHGMAKNTSPQFLASMGIYLFKKKVLLDLLEKDPREDFGKHLIPTQMSKGKTASFLYQGYWEDIGTVRSFYEANLALVHNTLNLNLYDESAPIYSFLPPLPSPRLVGTTVTDSIICQGSIVYAKEVTNSVIGIRSQIGENTVIRDCVLQGNQYYTSHENRPLTIGKNCRLEKVIIDENVTIGDDVTLTNQSGKTDWDGDGIYIRDGIIVVSSGTELPKGFIL